MSAGIPGFRVGAGPRGNFVRVGTRGVSYSTTLTSQSDNRATGRLPSSPLPTPVPMTDTTGVDVHQLVPTGPGDLVEQLNAAVGRRRLAPWVALVLVVVSLSLAPLGLIALALFLPLVWWLWLRDRGRRTAVAFYEVTGTPAEWFEELITAATRLAGAQGIWRITSAGAVTTTHQHKTNAGASSVVSRQGARVAVGGTPGLVTNVDVPTITMGGSSLTFLPDRVLLRQGRVFSDIGYDHLSTQAAPVQFIETGSVPRDAQRVGTTWKYVNVKGGPDRRFKDNKELPILMYGDLRLSSDGGLEWHLKVSAVPSALTMQRALAAPPRLAAVTENDEMPAAPTPALAPARRRASAAPPEPARPKPQVPTSRGTHVHLAQDGRVPVVGESYYQDALHRAANGASARALSDAIRVEAELIPEPDNTHDRHAVRVAVGGRTVGYLSREVARTYQPVLLALADRERVGICAGRIMGGGDRHYGIHLHVSSPDTIWPANQPENLSLLDTGRSVAVVGEERHQDTLRALSPSPRAAAQFSAFAGLGVCDIASGKYAGQQTVEVTINGARVGQLTKAQADRYLPVVTAAMAGGRRPGCHALVDRSTAKGLQVTLSLPQV